MNAEQRTKIATLLADDVIWSAYALADLQPAMAPYCRWFAHENGHGRGVALLYSGLTPPVLFLHGAPAALEAAIEGAALPETVYLAIQEAHEPLILRRYRCIERRPMWRMALRNASFTAGGQRRKEGGREGGADALRQRFSLKREFRLRRLTAADAVQVERLFAYGGPFTPDAFVPRQIEAGVFYGVENAEGELVAVGGTHIVDYGARIAAIGNMYTRPDARRRGAGGSILRALIETLQAGGVETIVLNVDQRNGAARRLYEQFGFAVHCPFIEGTATVSYSESISSEATEKSE
ncbi:MAG: GNAT family N-acetyltransferase [Caldilinea sp.]|nr:GNAT family N-acetyltransferase [Caldilinea sp.]MDW8442065.1 GNAT family N-acetyltransferase [Caldilineaceae bacterium]